MPTRVPLDQQSFNQWVWTEINNLRAQLVPPSLVTNFRVTPQPGGNLVDFTRSDGDGYVLYINTTPSINLAQRVTLGQANSYSHNVGDGGLTYYYAIQSFKGSLAGQVGNWVSGTTLALGTPATVPDPIPATVFPFENQATDSTEQAYPIGPRFEPLN